VSVGPDYDSGAERTDGFAATNSVSVRIRELDRAGAVLEAASRAGANQVHGPSLTREDRNGLEQKALERAVANARTRAQTLAEAAGVGVGRVTAIVEGVQAGGFYESRTAVDTASAEVPIEKGTEEIQATVTVTFAIE
jgi:uncharacterized protein YggE